MLLILSGIFAGVVFPLTVTLAGMQDGDGLMTALISTQKLTWYFWGQDRLLNVLPALTHPFTNIETNLRLQVMLRVFFAYLAPLGVLIFFNRQPRFLIVATAIANVVILSCLSAYGLFNIYVQHNTAGMSLVLLAAAYALTYSQLPKVLVALLVMLTLCVAYAANFALLTYALPMIVLIGALKTAERKRYGLFLAANLGAILVAKLHSSYFGEASTSYGLLISFDGIIESTKTLYENLHLFLFATFAAAAGICYRYAPQKRPWQIAAAVCIGLGLIVLLANTLWLKMNAYNIRYFITTLVIFTSVIGYLMAQVILSLNIRYSVIVGLCTVAIANCVMWGLGGFNSGYKELVGPAWRDQSAAVANVAVAQHARVIAGDFWDVWAAVYQTKREQRSLPKAERIAVYGGTFRAEILRDQFLDSVRGKGEQNALCFYSRADQCIQEIAARFHLAPEYTIVLKTSETLQISNRPMLKLVFEVN
jgi:hypothetical protein